MAENAGRRIDRRELDVTRQQVRAVAAQVAVTEDQVAETLEQLVATTGDPDGHRQQLIDQARRTATAERQRAGRVRASDGDR
jgi:hypothetical protein